MMAVVIGIVAVLAFLFSMLGLGGAILYIPVFKWFGYEKMNKQHKTTS